jgi:hypothetical protein
MTLVLHLNNFWDFIVADWKLNWAFFTHYWYLWLIWIVISFVWGLSFRR